MNKNSYFGFLVIASAMLGAMALSSCSHDDFGYSEEKVEQAVNAKYAAAFEKAFGKVGSDVDWGFSNKIYDVRAITRAGGEVYEPTITFLNDYNDNLFFADVPDGVNKASGSEVNGGEWYIDGTFQQFAMRSTGILYVKGTVDLSVADGFEVNAGTKIYLVKGATLKIGPNSAWNLKGDIYIADGATLETTEKLKINGASKVYTQRAITTQDGGIIKVKDLEVNSTSILYNSGTVIATGTVSAESNSSRIVNNGVIDCKDVVVNAGAVLNILEWKVSGTTKINSNNSGWINNGQWTTKDYAYIGGSENVINNCYLEVTNDFEMNISSKQGAFKINSDGGVLTTNFYGGRDTSTGAISGPFKIMMAQNSVFKVEETAVLESGRSSFPNIDKYEFGFFGPSAGYAVFQAKNIVREESIKNTWGAVTYGGNLYVSAETHFAQGNDGLSTHPYIIKQGSFSIDNNIYASGFKSGKPNITIEETNCCPGFQGDDPNPTYRVIAEDLNAQGDTDFDFNDVVFDVEPNEAGTAAKITVLAAGGIYRLEVDGVEVHKALLGGDGQINENGFYPMINTGDGPQVDPAVIRTAYAGDFSSDANIRATIQGITVKVWKPTSKNSKDVVECTLSANRGEPASKVLVDKSFGIVPEHHSIANSYGNFTNYVQGSFQDDFWWK